MQAIFVILGVFIACLQAASAESGEDMDVKRAIIEGLEGCVTELNLDKNAVIAHLQENVIPEDDADITSFFSCFGKALDTQDADGETDFARLEEVVKVMLKQRLQNLEDIKVQEITAAAIEHCKDTPKQESDGLTAIKIRNCIRAFVQKPELH